MHVGKSKLAIAVLLVFGFTSLAAAQANWNFNPVDEPFSMNQTGVNTSTVQIVSLTYDQLEQGGTAPITPENLEDDDRENITYYYNASEGNATGLNHLYEEYWYANFQPNFTRGDQIKYNASGTVNSPEGDVPSGEVVNVSEDLNVGDLKLHMLQGVDEWVKADSKIKLDVAVENASSGDMVTESEGSVQVSFANASGEVASYNLDNFNDVEDPDDYPNFDMYFFNSEVYFPAETNSTYVMHVEATNSTGQNPHGTWSKVIHTYPAIHGEITGFHSANGCNEKQMVERCEPGANISMDYNITASEAESVNLSINAFNESGKHELENHSLSETSNGFFESEIEVPDINTSKYQNKVEFVFNATNDKRMHIDRRNITVDQFVINRAGSPTAYAGSSYDMKIFLGKPYSLEPYNKSRFKMVEVNVTDSTGELVENFTMSELEYDESEGVMRTDLLIESDRPTGAYDLDVNAENIYNNTGTLSSGFNVRDVDATFEIDSELDFEVEKLGAQTFVADISNLLDTENQLNITEDLPEEIDVVNETAELSPGEEDFLELEINLSEMEDATGDFKLSDEDTNYNRTVEVSVDAAECQLTTGDLCTTTDEWINVTTDSTAEIVREIQLLHLRPGEENITFNASVSGEISDYVGIDRETENINLSDSMQLQLLYNPEDSGIYTGKVILETEDEGRMEIQTGLTVDISDESDSGGETGSEASLSVDPSTIELGYLPAGDSTSANVDVTNGGDATVSDLAVNSDTFSITASGVSELEAGETSELTLEFEDVQSENGDITITGGDAEATVSVSASPVQNYADRTSGLRDRLQELEGRVEDSELETDLTEAATKISTISTAWDSGNYEKAQRLYNEVDGTLQTVDSQVSTDPGTGGSGETSGGGFPVLLIAGLIFLLIAVGFVFYTSYIPEKGDPLYDVLGEK